ncbi:HAMP domain-containing histidine kinase [Pigmentiphaga aceris]|uniref:histidine kinase n=1 Tax=Pigmentiphaga aceris TaxID=1940612 RepID=A0A5C0ASD0_9BURK|nr:HAMP domain-containing sensor histidine kinase [Pigmentiphaga aceris]QEI05152.1 HAMP domain-containing histidine kinase [Pigmentiphaga aceris]
MWTERRARLRTWFTREQSAPATTTPVNTEPGLGQHLIWTHVLLTLLVGSVLTLVSVWSVNQLEAHLQRIDMGMAVERVRGEFLAGQDPGRPNRFFHGAPDSEAFPDWLRGLDEGFHKLERDGRVWHVMADDLDGVRYLLLRDYTDYERDQSVSHWVAVFGLACSMVMAFVLGSLATRRVVRPLLRLANQVGTRGAQPPQTRLADDYPSNEIGQLAAAFDDTYNQLEQALQREQLFTADVGHELRTPLMVVLTSCELLLDDDGLRPEQQAQLQRIVASVNDMRQRIDIYLMLARGRDNTDRFPRTGLADMARKEVEEWIPRASRRGMLLRLVEDTAIVPSIDPPQFAAPLLHGVLSNLIRNALQHAGPGVQVTVRVSATHLSVADNGPGIDPAQQPALFMPFVRGATGGPHNMGIGLSLVQRICTHQGWRVSLHSAPGEGTRIDVDLVPACVSI